MRKFVIAISAFALLFAVAACNPEENNNEGNQNNPDEIIVTGDALDVTDHEATLTGYANLPQDFGDAEVGILYDRSESFEKARRIVATELDANNMFSMMVVGFLSRATYYYKAFVQKGEDVRYGAVKSFTTKPQRVQDISIDKALLWLEIGGEATLSVTNIFPDHAADKSYTWSSSDNTIASVDDSGKVTAKAKGKAVITVTANDGSGVFASCSVGVYRIDVPQDVDMGTVVNGRRINWATFNIGASSPEEYGLYYAWGETEPKSDCSWNTYKWCNGTYESLTKYNTKASYGTVDNTTELVPEDDVAHVMFGGQWRIPTDADWKALLEQCTWVWTAQNGINGYLVTASNGNSIFLPAAGESGGPFVREEGSQGYYWSLSLNTFEPDCAWCVWLKPEEVKRVYSLRYNGLSIRPVLDSVRPLF